jgi:hypothetical protein
LFGASDLATSASGPGVGDYGNAKPCAGMHGSSMTGGTPEKKGMRGDMMGGCPMMGGVNGMEPKMAMCMDGEMMRAMSDIMLKYSDEMLATPAK